MYVNINAYSWNAHGEIFFYRAVEQEWRLINNLLVLANLACLSLNQVQVALSPFLQQKSSQWPVVEVQGWCSPTCFPEPEGPTMALI